MVITAVGTDLAAGMLNPLIGTLRLELSPCHILARVQTPMISIAWAGMPIGSLLSGAAADIFDLRLIYAAIGIAHVLVALAPLTVGSWLQLNIRHDTRRWYSPRPLGWWCGASLDGRPLTQVMQVISVVLVRPESFCAGDPHALDHRH